MSEAIKEIEIYFIRHAESTGNAAPAGTEVPFDEHHDPWLTEKGLDQAKKLGAALSDVDFDAVYSSALRRTISTAKGLLSGQKEQKKLFLLPTLSERGIPDTYRGQPLDELRKIYPECFVADGFDATGLLITQDKGFSDEAVFARAQSVIDYLRSRYKNGEKIAVVSHAAFLTYVIFRVFGLAEEMPYFDIDICNTGVTKLTYYRPGTYPYGDAVFSSINDTRHLNCTFD